MTRSIISYYLFLFLVSNLSFFSLNSAIYFGAYDTAKDMMDAPTFLTKFALAQSVAAVSVTAAYPFDTVRRRLMMMSGEGEKMYKNTMDCWRKIAADEGSRAFFKGNLANVIRSVGCALVLVMYDELIDIFKGKK